MSKVEEYIPGIKGTDAEFIDKHQQICGQNWKSCDPSSTADLHYYCPTCNAYAIVGRSNEQPLIQGFLRETK
jgi:hypothetical protein